MKCYETGRVKFHFLGWTYFLHNRKLFQFLQLVSQGVNENLILDFNLNLCIWVFFNSQYLFKVRHYIAVSSKLLFINTYASQNYWPPGQDTCLDTFCLPMIYEWSESEISMSPVWPGADTWFSLGFVWIYYIPENDKILVSIYTCIWIMLC